MFYLHGWKQHVWLFILHSSMLKQGPLCLAALDGYQLIYHTKCTYFGWCPFQTAYLKYLLSNCSATSSFFQYTCLFAWLKVPVGLE